MLIRYLLLGKSHHLLFFILLFVLRQMYYTVPMSIHWDFWRTFQKQKEKPIEGTDQKTEDITFSIQNTKEASRPISGSLLQEFPSLSIPLKQQEPLPDNATKPLRTVSDNREPKTNQSQVIQLRRPTFEKKTFNVSIGFDWGSGTSKIMYRIYQKNGNVTPKPIRFEEFLCEANSDNYLPISAVCDDDDHLSIMTDTTDSRYERKGFKAFLITQSGPSRFMEDYAVFNLATLLNASFQHILSESDRLFHNTEPDSIEIAFGIPVDDMQENAIKKRFSTLFNLAINISIEYKNNELNGIGKSDFHIILEKYRGKEIPDNWKMTTQPEVFAEISAFADLPQVRNEYLVVIDIGNSTLDFASFRSSWNKPAIQIIAALVEKQGITFYQDLPSVQFRKLLYNNIVYFFCACTGQWIHNFFLSGYQLKYYFFGGGAYNTEYRNLIVKCINTAQNVMNKQFIKEHHITFSEGKDLLPESSTLIPSRLLTRYQVCIGLVGEGKKVALLEPKSSN